MAYPQGEWAFFAMNKFVDADAHLDDEVTDDSLWSGFLSRLADLEVLSRQIVPPSGPVDRADVSRNLLQMLHFGLERLLGSGDPYRPFFSRPWPVHYFDWGGGNPDAVYRTVVISDDATYRIFGRVGNADFMSFEFFEGQSQRGQLLREDLEPGDDGRFQIYLGPKQMPGPWLEITPGTAGILTREFFADWGEAQPSELHIECIDGPSSSWPQIAPGRVGRELEALAGWMRASVEIWAGRSSDGRQRSCNRFDPTPSRADTPLPYVYHAFYDLGDDECLLMEFPNPPSRYFGVQLMTGLWSTFNHAHRHSSLNSHQVTIDEDGVLRMVIAHRDPGINNWLDTIGHRQGGVLMRVASAVERSSRRPARLQDTQRDWMDHVRTGTSALTEGIPVVPPPQCRVVKLAELDRILPANTPRVDSAERQAIILQRLREIERLIRC